MATEKPSFLSKIPWARLAGPVCLLAPALAAAWLLWPALSGSKMLWGYDLQGLGLPFQFSARRSWAQGLWPLWMPEIFQGMPGLASANLDFLYPTLLALNTLGVPLTGLYGYNAFGQLCLAAWGAYLFCRSLGTGRPAALLGGTIFAFSGTHISLLYCGHTNNLNAVPLIPWIFFASTRGLQAMRRAEGRSFKDLVPGLAWWSLAGVGLGFQVLGLGMQIFAYTVLALAVYTSWNALLAGEPQALGSRRQMAARVLLGFGLAILAGLLVGAPQWLITWQYMPYSWHARLDYATFTAWSFPPAEAVGYLVPGFYGWMDPTYRGQMASCTNTEYLGLLPWALACAALFARGRDKRGPVLFFAAAAALSFLVALGKWTPLHLLFYNLPVFSGFRSWNRFLCLVTFCVSVLAAFGWDALADPAAKKSARLAGVGFALAGAAVGLVCYLQSPAAAGSIPPAMFAHFSDPSGLVPALKVVFSASSRFCVMFSLGLAALLGLIAWPRLRRPALLASALPVLLAFHFADLSDMHRRFAKFKDARDVVVVENYANFLPNPLKGEPYRVWEQDHIWDFNEEMYLGYENVRGYHGLGMMPNYRFEKAMDKRPRDFMDLLGARYFLARDPRQMEGVTLVAGGPDQLYVYENTRAFHRAWLAYRGRAVASEREAWDMIWNGQLDPLKEVAVESGPALDSVPREGDGVAWLSRDPQRLYLRVVNRQNAYLVLSQTWYPGWKAWVDQQETPVFRAWGAFQAVCLPAGDHQVLLRFTCPLFYLGLFLCGLGLALATGLVVLWRRAVKGHGPGGAA